MPIQRMQRAALFLTLLVLLVSLPLTIVVAQAQEIVRVGGQVDWSPDGKLVAVANGRGLTLFDANLRPTSPAINNIGVVVNFSWSSDSRSIVTIHPDAIARIWDVQSGKITRTLEGHTDRLTGVAWGHNNTQIATTSYDYSIRIWDVATGKTIRTISSQMARPLTVAWNPQVDRIGVVLDSGDIKFWDLPYTKQQESAGIDNTFGGTVLLWRHLTYFMINGYIVWYQSYDSKAVMRPPVGPEPCSFTSVPSVSTWSYGGGQAGDVIVYANTEAGAKVVCVLEATIPARSFKKLMVVRVQDNSFKQFGSVSSSPDRKTVVALSDDGGTLYAWDLATGKQLTPLKLDAPVPTPSASPTR